VTQIVVALRGNVPQPICPAEGVAEKTAAAGEDFVARGRLPPPSPPQKVDAIASDKTRGRLSPP